MVALDTVSHPGNYILSSGSERPAREEWMVWLYEPPVTPVTEIMEQASAFPLSEPGGPGPQAYRRMADAVTVRGIIGTYLTEGTHGSSTSGDYPDARRESLKREVYDLLIDAGTDNWDGEGALALQHDTVAVAQELIHWFPPYIGAPDIAATPHGEVDFDWVVGREIMLTVSVGPSKEIAFAGLFHGARLNGCEPWKGVLPHFVHCCFERLREAKNT